MSKESFLNLLKTTRVFEQETEENTYLAIVKDIQAKRAGGAGGSGGPDVSVINQRLRELQEKYIIQLQQLLNGVGADKPYYTGVEQYAVVGGYETDNREGFLQMPVIMNSKRYNDMKSELFLRHGTIQANRGVHVLAVGQGVQNAGNLTLAAVQRAHQAIVNGAPVPPPNNTDKIIRTTGGNFALRVSPRDLGNGHSEDDFKLTKPVNLGDVKQIDKDAFDKIVSDQTVYSGPDTPPDVSQSSFESVVRAVCRGNGTQVAAADASACLAGLIPFDESIFTNLLQEKEDGLVQSQTSDGVTDKPIIWRGKSYSLRAGTTNSLFGDKDKLKSGQDTGSGQVFPKLDKLKDTSESNMITALELDKLCKDFQTKLSECNEVGADKGWRGLGWLFTPSQDGVNNGGCFNPDYSVNGNNLHLVDKQGKKVVVKTAEGQNGGGLKLENVVLEFAGGQINVPPGGNTAIHTNANANHDRFDQTQDAYAGNPGPNFLYTLDDPAQWNAANGGGAATINDIAEITRRRCILFLFHFLEKAFGARWYTSDPNGQGLYKVVIKKDDVYKKLSDWDQVEKWWSYTSTAEACIGTDGVVCSYNGEKNPAVAWNNNNPLYPEKLSPQDCLLCFARHLFIGKQTDAEFTNVGGPQKPRHAHEDEVKVWDIIEEFLPKFYRCALVIKHKETVKDFYTKLETHYTKSSALADAKKVKDEKKEATKALQTELLNSYPPDMYRDLMIRMYDKDPQVKEDRKRYCCCENEMQPYKGDGQRPNFQQCSICAVAHYFFDIPEARDSYDFKTFGHEREDMVQKVNENGDRVRFSRNATNNPQPGVPPVPLYPSLRWVRMEAQDDFNHACSDWHEFKWPQNNAQPPQIFKLDTPNGDNIRGSPFDISKVQRDSKSTAVVAFDKKNNSNKYGIYVANDDTEYSIQLAKHKIQWPKLFLGQTGFPLGTPPFPTEMPVAAIPTYANGAHIGEYIILKNPDPPDSTLTVKRKSHSQKHCLDGTPPYPIKHLAYKAVLQDEAPLFLDMQSVHGKAKNIIINFISGWEAKKERYDISKAGTKKEEGVTPESKKSSEESVPGSTPGEGASPGESAIAPGGEQGVTPATGDTSSGKDVADSVLPFKEKELDKPSVTSLEQAKSKQVVELSDYQKLEDEYKRVERETKRKNELLKAMVAEYRTNNLVQQGDMTANRIKRDSDNKRRILLEGRIKELQRNQKKQLDSLRVAMMKMKEKEEMYEKQLQEMRMIKENQLRSQMEANMHGIVASEMGLQHQYQSDIKDKKLRKAQAKYLGLSGVVDASEYDLMRMKSDVKERRNVPHIFSKDKKPKRTQSKKRANRREEKKEKKTPKKTTA
tara:strand:- start:546 stop:4574 length:4029 start_codon:yes stop_codon:yes gene_type:complete